MKVLINIPKEFEEHFNQDRFEDSLHRLSADAHLLAGNYESELCDMLVEAFDKALLLDEATIEQLCEENNPYNNCQEYSCYMCEYDHKRRH